MEGNATVTAAGIARLAGVGRAAVSNWRKRHADFPAQVAGTSASPEFDLAAVTAWLRAQGKLPDLASEETLWWRIEAAGDTPASALGVVGTYLLDRRRPADPRLHDLLQEVGALADDRGARETFDALLARFSRSPSARVRPSPDDLARLMASLAGVAGATVLDPACGTGSLLRACVEAGCATAFGQDIDESSATLARIWLTLHDVPGEVRIGDSLRHDAYADTTVDAVVCSPPFGITNWGLEDLAYDPRWEYGTPPRTEPELAWVQHALAHLRPGGRAVVLMPPAAAGRRAGRRIRAELLRNGAVRGVVALPARTAAPHGVPLHLWVLRRPVPGDPPPAHVLLVDATEVDLATAHPRILAAFAGDAAPDPDLARPVPVIELLGPDVDLSPVRRPAAVDARDSGVRLGAARTRLAELLAELPGLVPDVRVAETAAAPATSSIGELAKAGAVQILGPVRVVDAEASSGRPVLAVKDVLHGTPPSGREEGPVSPEIEVREGDVVVPVMARRLTAHVVTSGGAVLGRNLYLLRPNDAALDPWFLAGHLRTSGNERQASSLSGVLRFDVRRARVPRMALAEQRRYAEVFRRLHTFDTAMRAAADLADDLVRMAADGLARGIVQPDGMPDSTAKRQRRRT